MPAIATGEEGANRPRQLRFGNGTIMVGSVQDSRHLRPGQGGPAAIALRLAAKVRPMLALAILGSIVRH